MEGTPLLDVLRGLILDPEAQADFAADPAAYMQRFGHDDVPEDDLSEAVGLVADTLPPDVAHAVTSAAASSPADDDPLGGGPVGLLGRISTAEVTESVVPPLDDLPDHLAEPGAGDDLGAAFAADHDSDPDPTAFGDVTRDFDAETGAAGDPGDAEPGGSLADETDETAEAGGPGDASFGDISFGDADLDADPGAFAPSDPAPDTGAPTDEDSALGAGGTGPDLPLGTEPSAGDTALEDVAGGPEAFGQGSGATVEPEADPHLPEAGGAAAPFGPDPDDPGDGLSDGAEAGPPPVPDDPSDGTHDEAAAHHPADDGLGGADGADDQLDDPGDGSLDGDPGFY